MSSGKKKRPGHPVTIHPDPSTLGGLIKQARMRRGWTLQEFADRMGIARAYVQKIEGDQSEVSFAVIARGAKLLKLRFDRLARVLDKTAVAIQANREKKARKR